MRQPRRTSTAAKTRAFASTVGPVDANAVLLGELSEREFQAHVLAVAKRNGWLWFHDAATNAPRVCWSCKAPARGPRNASGLPDLLLVREDRILWAELKAQDGTTTPEQREWIARLRAAGQTVYVWRPADWPVIEKVLARE